MNGFMDSARAQAREFCAAGEIFLDYDFAKSYQENVAAGKRIGAILDGTGSVDGADKTSTSAESAR